MPVVPCRVDKHPASGNLFVCAGLDKECDDANYAEVLIPCNEILRGKPDPFYKASWVVCRECSHTNNGPNLNSFLCGGNLVSNDTEGGEEVVDVTTHLVDGEEVLVVTSYVEGGTDVVTVEKCPEILSTEDNVEGTLQCKRCHTWSKGEERIQYLCGGVYSKPYGDGIVVDQQPCGKALPEKPSDGHQVHCTQCNYYNRGPEFYVIDGMTYQVPD